MSTGNSKDSENTLVSEIAQDPSTSASASASSGNGITRRKLAYIAPALLSRSMFYGAAGCGKGNPRMLPCQTLRRSSS